MARKTRLVVIDDGTRESNRDFGKRFLIKEMPAFQAEKWAQRAFLALTHAGANINEDIKNAGFAGFVVAGLQALPMLQFGEIEPLLDEMLGCVHAAPDPAHPEITRPLQIGTPDGEGDDIDEVATYLRLRKEVLDLHTAFFDKGALSTSTTGTSTTSPAS